MNFVLIGTLASLLAGCATGIGSLPIFFLHKISDKFIDLSLGFAAGIMLSATFFSLITPAIEIGGLFKSITGIVAGTIFLIYSEKFTPHIHYVAGIKGPSTQLSKLWLFILAITIHNFPEGLAVGVGFGTGDLKSGIILSTGIGLQNIPEGLVVALALSKENINKLKAFTVALLTGLVEPIGGLIGSSIISIGQFLLPYSLAFAAGAMLFVISEEIIPETHSRGNSRQATIGLIAGFILMMALEFSFY